MRIRTKVSDNILPSGYTELEYIESVYPNQYLIDTGVLVSSTLVTEITLIPNENYLSENAIFGGDWTANGYFLMFYQNKIRFHSKNFVCDVSSFNKNGINIIKTYSKDLTDNILEINGVSYRYTHTAGGQTPDVSQNISIFKPTGNSYISSKYGYFKLCNFKMYDNDVLIRNFIPALRESDNKIGLYDLVNNQFYTNSKTGELLYKNKNDSFKVNYYKASRLPNEYQEVEYIQSTGTQWIDSLVPYSSTLKIEVGFSDLTNNTRNGGVFGTNGWLYSLTNYGTNQLRWCPTNNTMYNYNSLTTTGKYDVVCTVTSLTVNGVSCTQEGDNGNGGSGNINISKTHNGYGKMKFYYFKIYNNDTLVRNFVPCYRKSDSVIGLYDLVNDQLYTNSGSGVFLKGNNVNGVVNCTPKLYISPIIIPSEYQEVEYIESAGEQYINTGINGKRLMSFDVDFEYTNFSTSKASVLIGSQPPSIMPIMEWQGKLQYMIGNYYTFYPYFANVTVNTRYKVHFEYNNDNIVANVNGTDFMAQTSEAADNNCNLYIFAFNINNLTYNKSSAKLYSCKIYDNNTLVRNFIPCYRKSDSVIGLYDTVTQQFFTNQGTGTFTKGNNKNTII